jgi:hypothetical protein
MAKNKRQTRKLVSEQDHRSPQPEPVWRISFEAGIPRDAVLESRVTTLLNLYDIAGYIGGWRDENSNEYIVLVEHQQHRAVVARSETLKEALAKAGHALIEFNPQ